ncbi:membrane protein [Streptomyces iranensis]|uniref:Oligopeptide transporter (OPT) family protein n=1 Tax=Streptomyces iranensis TaxID=576784 RepID=A0A060ZJV9_9ACTN|nr:membrane protein [Streptomyces iranensis]MBP2060913.1 putative oligopeptide transporter (OPT) family protein [Streptomyces iranensis]CDR06380.1 Oligopeptide transporter OPT superfamilyprotein [Streptomyces iranensis]
MNPNPQATTAADAPPRSHPRAFEPVTLVLTIVLSVLGALIGIVLITTLGVSPNTAVIGALVAMLIGRVPVGVLTRMRSKHRQNLVQSAISGSTFAAANSLLTPIAVPFALGRNDLVWPMLGGAVIGLAVDSWVLYRVFDSKLLPATGSWPAGIAAAETINAGDTGGRKAAILGVGAVVGFVGALFKLPTSAAGVGFLGNIWALAMFGIGLTVGQYAPDFGFDLGANHVPHGLMIGAGLVALTQALLLMRTRKGGGEGADQAESADGGPDTDGPDADGGRTVRAPQLRRGLLEGMGLFICGAVVVAIAGGVVGGLSLPALVGWVLLAGVAAIVHQLIVGLAAMHSGWFPAFAVTLIFLIIGLVLHIPTVPLALLVGYTASTGPAFADLGYDFKAGWLLRRDAAPWRPFEIEGRRQQYLAQLVGFGVALVVVAVAWKAFFSEGKVPPVAEVYVTTIKTGLEPGTMTTMLLWAIPGALVQLIGGPSRQMGVLLATGLLVATPQAGWMVLGALVVRQLYTMWRRRGIADARARKESDEQAENDLSLVGAGLVAGSSLNDVGQLTKAL